MTANPTNSNKEIRISLIYIIHNKIGSSINYQMRRKLLVKLLEWYNSTLSGFARKTNQGLKIKYNILFAF